MNDFDFSPLGLVCKNAIPVEEAKSAISQYNKIIFGKKVNTAANLIQKGQKLQSKKEYTDAIATYKEAKAIMQSVKKDAANVPDENWKDVVASILPFIAGQRIGIKSVEGLGKDATRKRIMSQVGFDITYLDQRIKECREAMKKGA